MVWPIIDEVATVARLILGGQREQVNAPGSRVGLRNWVCWLRKLSFSINLTLGYNSIGERREPGRKPPGPQERPSPQEEVGQEGIRPQDARMGQARRQTEGQRQSRTEGEVNRGYLQAWGSVLGTTSCRRAAGC